MYAPPKTQEEKERRARAQAEGHAKRRAECEALGIPHRKKRKDTLRNEQLAAERLAKEAIQVKRIPTPTEEEDAERKRLWIIAYRQRMEAKALAKYSPTRGKKRKKTPPAEVLAELEADDAEEG